MVGIIGVTMVFLVGTTSSLPVNAQDEEIVKFGPEATSSNIKTQHQGEKTEATAAQVGVLTSGEINPPAHGRHTSKFPLPTIRGRFLVDVNRVSDVGIARDKVESDIRSARIGIKGKAPGNLTYKFIVDLADNELTLEDAFLEYNDSFGALRVGHFKSANSLEEITSLRHVTFLERAAFTDAFNLDRHWGAAYITGGANWSFEAGAFVLDAPDVTQGTGRVVAGRVTYGGQIAGSNWMLGASVRHRDARGGAMEYSQPAHLRLSEDFLATGPLAEKDFFLGLESGLQAGSFYLASEWGGTSVQTGDQRNRDTYFYGYYIEGGWFLTGETKPLNAGKGVWERPDIRRPVASGGPGAWQIAARFDRLDLTGSGVYGGEQNTYVLGVNWYAAERIRFTANYSYSAIRNALNVPLNEPGGSNRINAFGLRFQADW